MLLTFTLVSLACALLPLALFAANFRIFTAPPPVRVGQPLPSVSVLIPARNEEATIAEALRAVLATEQVEFEVIVLDDASTDATAALVSKFAEVDPRVRLVTAPALPVGWNGKQHACRHLAQLARHPCLLFVDADVRLTPDALPRLVHALKATDLLSGVPRQITRSFSEKFLIPLIHFVLLGFLPLARMRASRDPSLGAGCGQLFLTTREAYAKAGGHAAIRSSLHDGLHLSRLYRAAALRTDVVDITALASCQMYHGDAATWIGLAKNAHQGMGARRVILPMTILLLAGQVAPWTFLLAGFMHPIPALIRVLSSMGALSGLLIRLVAARRFHQSLVGALLHPLGVVSLLAIQWWAQLRFTLGYSSRWKDRACP